jgi:hypothetical protein
LRDVKEVTRSTVFLNGFVWKRLFSSICSTEVMFSSCWVLTRFSPPVFFFFVQDCFLHQEWLQHCSHQMLFDHQVSLRLFMACIVW